MSCSQTKFPVLSENLVGISETDKKNHMTWQTASLNLQNLHTIIIIYLDAKRKWLARFDRFLFICRVVRTS